MKTMMLLIVAGVAVAQWLVFAIMSMTARESFPRRGMRRAEKMLLASSAILAIAFLAQIDYAALWKGSSATTNASAVTTSRGSCATIGSGMTAAEVKSRMGEPDRTTPDEETRGPGALTLFYASSRCSVHLFDGKVEAVD